MDKQTTKHLLDAAKKHTGSDYKTAALLHVTPATLSNWRYERKHMPAADVALTASLAGFDAVAWGSRALIDPHEGTPKGEMLKKALKKALPAIGVTIASSGVNAMPIFSMTEKGIVYFIRCIEVLTDRRQHVRC